MRNIIIALGALLGGSSAFAINPTNLAADRANGTLTTVVLSGSSAFRDQMELTLKVLCDGTQNDSYGADASFGSPATSFLNAWDGTGTKGGTLDSYNGPDFRAYSCILKNPLPAQTPALTNGNLAGKPILVYYRAEGGSVYGVAPLALNATIQRLDVPDPANVPAGEVACSGPGVAAVQQNGLNSAKATDSAGFVTWLCAVPAPLSDLKGTLGVNSSKQVTGQSGWWLPYDNWVPTAGVTETSPTCAPCLAAYGGKVDLVLDTPTMGVSDVDPAALTGLNYPLNNFTGSNVKFTALTAAQRATLAPIPILQQLFGALLSTEAGSAVTPNLAKTAAGNPILSRQSLAGIYTGAYTNWSQVPEAAGIAGNNVAITICRRDRGSGTQTASAIYFGNDFCGNASSFENDNSFIAANGTSVLYYATTGDVQACLQTHTDSIGISSVSSPKASTIFAAIDGIDPTQANLLKATYHDWQEVQYVKGPQFTAASAAQQALINGLIQGTADSAVGSIAANAGYAYIPNQVDAFGTDNAPSIANLANLVNIASRGSVGGVDGCVSTPIPSNPN